MLSSQILLASHGTEGAIAAEHIALNICDKGGSIHHLIVVPDLWKGMKGDDWLNNGATRDTYGDYLEAELSKEVHDNIDRVEGMTKTQGVNYSFEVVVGKPDECLIKASSSKDYDIVVMGSPRPKHISGLRSRIKTEPLTRALKMPLLIAPYPDE